jgi:hypothetical protein
MLQLRGLVLSLALAAAVFEVTGPALRADTDLPASRVPWHSSRVTGSPDPPPPYVAGRAFPAAKFKGPVFIVWAPAMNRFFVGERRGVMYSLANRPDAFHHATPKEWLAA